MFSCKFAAYLQNTFLQKHNWRTASSFLQITFLENLGTFLGNLSTDVFSSYIIKNKSFFLISLSWIDNFPKLSLATSILTVCSSLRAAIYICLTLSRRRPLSYRNQSIDLLRKPVDWFLYDNGLRLERVKKTLFLSDFFRLLFHAVSFFKHFWQCQSYFVLSNNLRDLHVKKLIHFICFLVDYLCENEPHRRIKRFINHLYDEVFFGKVFNGYKSFTNFKRAPS